MNMLIGMMRDMMLNPFHRGLGVKDGKLKEMPYTPNAVSSQSTQPSKKVEALDYKNGSLEDSKGAILTILRSSTEDVEVKCCDGNYVYAIYTSKGMKFKDDVEFYFDDATKKVEFRSASRIGMSDMGVNRKRYETIRDAYYAS